MPDPVGPAQITMPYGERMSVVVARRSVSAAMPSVGQLDDAPGVLSRSRSTHFSPNTVGVVDTRTSRSRPSIVTVDLAVLRAAALDDVHVGHDLDAADERRAHRTGQRHDLVQRAVGADADAHAVGHRLDVHVGRAVAHGLLEDEVDDLDDRRVLVDDGLHDRLGRLRRLARFERAPRTCAARRRGRPTARSIWLMRLSRSLCTASLMRTSEPSSSMSCVVEVLGERVGDRDLDAAAVAVRRQRAAAGGRPPR